MAKSPIKFGLGKYSDKPFELKSGNTPIFKHVGSSPYEDEGEGKGQGWKKALTLVGEMALSGLDAVYGTGKVVSGSERLTKKDDKKVCKDKDGNVVSCDSPNAVDTNDVSEPGDKV